MDSLFLLLFRLHKTSRNRKDRKGEEKEKKRERTKGKEKATKRMNEQYSK
jgi:hypothetical protein